MTPIEQLRALQELFGGGPLAAAVAVVLMGWVALFVLYVRAKNAHLATVEKLAPIADRMTDLLAQTIDELREAREILEIHKPKRRGARHALRQEAPTVILPGPPGDGGGKKD